MGTGGRIEAPTLDNNNNNMSNNINNNNSWRVRPDVLLFGVQMASVFLVVLVSLVNLSLNVGNQQLWTIVLTGSLGYIMPNPKIKVVNGKTRNGVDDSPTSSTTSEETTTTTIV